MCLTTNPGIHLTAIAIFFLCLSNSCGKKCLPSYGKTWAPHLIIASGIHRHAASHQAQPAPGRFSKPVLLLSIDVSGTSIRYHCFYQRLLLSPPKKKHYPVSYYEHLCWRPALTQCHCHFYHLRGVLLDSRQHSMVVSRPKEKAFLFLFMIFHLAGGTRKIIVANIY